jgi:hypothetical protein
MRSVKMESKPTGMWTIYTIRTGIQKLIRKFETDKSIPGGFSLAVGGYLALLKTHELEVDYRRNRKRTGPMEFFGDDVSKSGDKRLCKEHDTTTAHAVFKPWDDDEPEDGAEPGICPDKERAAEKIKAKQGVVEP